MKKINDSMFYKDIYNYEISRKENLNSKLPTYIGLLTVLGGIIVFEIENLYQNIKIDQVIQIELIILIIVILGINIYNLYKANHNKKYKYIDNPKNLEKAFKKIEVYYKEYYEFFKKENETLEELINRKKEERLIELYIDCTETNAIINDARNEENMNFIRTFIISLIIICIIGILCIVIKKPLDINILKGG